MEKNKVVIYARYSSHNQTERSIEGQLQDCYEYAKRCGFIVVGEYIDRAMTGTNDNRENFQRMIADSAKKQFNYIIVYKLDRFARNRYDSAIYKNKIKKHGVKVLSAMEQISDSPEGIILESVLEGMAEYYSANLSQHVKRGLREAVKNKTFTGGVPPFGYKVVDKQVVIDENLEHIVKWIFAEYAAGTPKKDIVAELKRRGIKSVRGNEFTIGSLQHVLPNKKYIGIAEFDGEEIIGMYPPIIDEQIFYKVQKQLEKKKQAPAASAGADYILQGKAFCGYCGKPMVGECGYSSNKANKTRYNYYACAKKKAKHTCKKKNEKKDFIEWYIVEQTVLYVLEEKRKKYIAERVVDVYNKDFNEDEVKKLQKQIRDLDKELNELVEVAIASKNSAIISKIDERADRIQKQREALEEDLTKLKIASSIKIEKTDVERWLNAFCNGDPCDEEFRKRIVDTFINSVYIYDDKLVIYFNLKEGKQVSYIEMIEDVEAAFGADCFVDSEKSSDFKTISPP